MATGIATVAEGELADGVRTVRGSQPRDAILAAGITAVNCVLLTWVVGRAVVPIMATLVEKKFVPVMVMVVSAEPAMMLLGLVLVIVGDTAVTVMLTAADVPPPGAALLTVMASVPGSAISSAVGLKLSCVPLVKEVVWDDPLTSTFEELTKPVPVTVTVGDALPAMMD
jgi:hypothetical protein